MTRGREVWSRHRDVVWRRTGDRVLILAPDEEIITMGRTGVDLWQQLEHPSSLSALADRMAALYDAAPDQVERDLVPVLEDLERRHAVRRGP